MPRKPGTSANGFTKKCQLNSHIGRLEIAHLVSEAATSPLPDSVQRFNDFNCEMSFSFHQNSFIEMNLLIRPIMRTYHKDGAVVC